MINVPLIPMNEGASESSEPGFQCPIPSLLTRGEKEVLRVINRRTSYRRRSRSFGSQGSGRLVEGE